MKSKIKAHKGGRSESGRYRLTKREKALVDKVRGKLSLADWMIKKAQEELAVKYAPYKGIEIEATDNGEKFDLAWALELLDAYEFQTPLDAELDPTQVRWLAGQEARLNWEHEKTSGYAALIDWDDEEPYIWWTS